MSRTGYESCIRRQDFSDIYPPVIYTRVTSRAYTFEVPKFLKAGEKRLSTRYSSEDSYSLFYDFLKEAAIDVLRTGIEVRKRRIRRK